MAFLIAIAFPVLSAEAWSALTSSVGVVVAICALIVESRRARFVHAIEMITTLDQRFSGAEFRANRKAAAAYLLDPKKDDIVGKEALNNVLNFFESVGFLYTKGVISKEVAWQFFAAWLIPYYSASTDFMRDQKSDDPNCYSELVSLFQDVRRIEEKCHPTKDHINLNRYKYLNVFLSREAQLEESANSQIGGPTVG